jgi:hypothetical protein
MSREYVILFFLFLIFLPLNLYPSDFLIVKEGKPMATIVVPREMNHSTAFAVWDFHYHIQKITGVLLPVAFEDENVKGNKIYIGESKATRKLGIKSENLKEQEYIIRFYPDSLVLLGRDEKIPFSDNIRILGDIGWDEGKFGKALSFSGKGTLCIDDFNFNDEEGSFEVWVYLEEKPQEAGEGTIIRLDGANPWTYHIIGRWEKNRIRYITYDGENGHCIFSSELPPGWHHILATYSAPQNKMELFIDGQSQGTTDYKKTTCNGTTLLIGGFPDISQNRVGNAFSGRIDEVRISNIIRSPALPDKPYQADAKTLLLLHLDEGKGVPKDARGIRLGRPISPPDMFAEQGTSYAVHDFLERFCDVRWYGPKEDMIYYPQKKTLAVKPQNIQRRPTFLYRGLWPPFAFGIVQTLWDNPSQREMNLFWARHKAGGEKYACNHSFYGYYDRFLKTHPEFFAKGYEGQPPQMCYSNPGFIAQVIQDAKDYFDGKGTHPGAFAAGDYFALVPMDNNLWCKCEECQSQLDPERRNDFFSNGYASDYWFNFVNKVAGEILKSHPKKFIATLAYWEYAYHPKKVKLLPNISVQMCLHIRNFWAPAMRDNDLNLYKEWIAKEKGRRFYLWLYYCFPEEIAMNGGFHCFPGFFAHTASKYYKMFAKDGIRGVFLNGLGEQIDTYVTLKLLDDPNIDVDKLLDEFFSRYYGSASEPMKKMYLMIEKIYGDPANYPEYVQKEKRHFHQTEEIAWGYLGTEERMRELGKLMEEAKRLAKTDLEKKRVSLFEKGVWQYMVEGREMYLRKKRIEEKKRTLEPEREKLRAEAPPRISIPSVPSCSGDLDKVNWDNAVVLDKWYTVEGYPTERKLEARLVKDEGYLYIRLEEKLPTERLKNSEDIWTGDDWEIFLAEQRDAPYYQIGIAPDGRSASYYYEGIRQGMKKWESEARVKSEILPDRWIVSIALPLKNLKGVAQSQRLYANFYRASFTLDDLKLRELLAWSPNFSSDFHQLTRLGELVFE